MSFINEIKEKARKNIKTIILTESEDKRVLQAAQKVKEEGLSFLQGVRLGTFTVPGDGEIDFKPIFDILDESGYEGWMIVEAEQDPAIANPLEYALKARKYIRKTAGI